MEAAHGRTTLGRLYFSFARETLANEMALVAGDRCQYALNKDRHCVDPVRLASGQNDEAPALQLESEVPVETNVAGETVPLRDEDAVEALCLKHLSQRGPIGPRTGMVDVDEIADDLMPLFGAKCFYCFALRWEAEAVVFPLALGRYTRPLFTC